MDRTKRRKCSRDQSGANSFIDDDGVGEDTMETSSAPPSTAEANQALTAVSACESTGLTNSCYIDLLPNELLLHIFSFMDKKTLLRAQLVCRRWLQLYRQSWRQIWRQIIAAHHRLPVKSVDIEALDQQQCSSLSVQVPLLPNRLVHDNTIQLEDPSDPVHWIRLRDGVDYSMDYCAILHLPLSGRHLAQNQHAIQAVCHKDSGVVTFRQEPCSYFEVEVGERIDEAPARSQDEVLAVGLAASGMPLCGFQPGWARSSVGYHGDDGHAYLSTGHGRDFGPRFGQPGDVIGCGIDHINRGIFMTLNGNMVGFMIPIYPAPCEHLYPVVGVGLYNRVRFNAGDRPFKFQWRPDTFSSLDPAFLHPNLPQSVVRRLSHRVVRTAEQQLLYELRYANIAPSARSSVLSHIRQDDHPDDKLDVLLTENADIGDVKLCLAVHRMSTAAQGSNWSSVTVDLYAEDFEEDLEADDWEDEDEYEYDSEDGYEVEAEEDEIRALENFAGMLREQYRAALAAREAEQNQAGANAEGSDDQQQEDGLDIDDAEGVPGNSSASSHPGVFHLLQALQQVRSRIGADLDVALDDDHDLDADEVDAEDVDADDFDAEDVDADDFDAEDVDDDGLDS